MLGVVACVLAVVWNRCNNSQQVWDLQCIVGRIQPISLGNPCVMSVRGPNNVGRAVQTDPTLLRYASAITEQKKCWELLAEKFDRFQTLRNNTQQHPTSKKVCKRTQHVTSNNAGICWPTMLRPFARGFNTDFTLLYSISFNSSGAKFEKLYQKFRKRMRKSCLVFTSSTKCEIRHFHVVIVKRRQRNKEK